MVFFHTTNAKSVESNSICHTLTKRLSCFPTKRNVVFFAFDLRANKMNMWFKVQTLLPCNCVILQSVHLLHEIQPIRLFVERGGGERGPNLQCWSPINLNSGWIHLKLSLKLCSWCNFPFGKKKVAKTHHVWPTFFFIL